jgi:hypothetical protein
VRADDDLTLILWSGASTKEATLLFTPPTGQGAEYTIIVDWSGLTIQAPPIVVTGQQVYLEDESTLYTGSGTVKDPSGEIEIGTVTNGKLALAFPTVEATDALIAELGENADSFDWGVAGLTQTPNTAKSYQMDLRLFNDDGDIGIKRLKIDGNNARHDVEYFYFDGPCTITGSVNGGTITVSINAVHGWNEIYWRYPENGPGTLTPTLITTENIPTDLKWVLVSGGGGGEPSPNTIEVEEEQVYNMDESTDYTGTGTVKIGDLVIGTVSTGGKLTLTLPATGVDTYLVDVTAMAAALKSKEGWDNVTVTEGEDANAQVWDNLDLYSGENKIGELLLGKSDGWADGFHGVRYFYFDSHVNITGTLAGGGDGTIQFSGGPGWISGGNGFSYHPILPTEGTKWVFKSTATGGDDEDEDE